MRGVTFDPYHAGGIIGDAKGPGRLEVYFSNPDFVFANEFASPRFGQGALAIALKALLKEVQQFSTAPHKSRSSSVLPKELLQREL